MLFDITNSLIVLLQEQPWPVGSRFIIFLYLMQELNSYKPTHIIMNPTLQDDEEGNRILVIYRSIVSSERGRGFYLICHWLDLSNQTNKLLYNGSDLESLVKLTALANGNITQCKVPPVKTRDVSNSHWHRFMVNVPEKYRYAR